jgi:carbonic anhydrase
MEYKTRKSVRLKSIIGIVVAVLLITACNLGNKKGDSSISNEFTISVDGAEKGLEHDLLQSPINIVSEQTAEGSYQVALNYAKADEQVKEMALITQLDIQPDNSIKLDSMSFQFSQIHFHSPSEHRIDGESYPLEMHVVSTVKDSDRPEYLVLVLLFEEGDSNFFLNELSSQDFSDEEATRDKLLNLIMGARLLQQYTGMDLKGIYKYKGSLRSEPYTESVNWLIVKRVFEASTEQIDQFAVSNN